MTSVTEAAKKVRAMWRALAATGFWGLMGIWWWPVSALTISADEFDNRSWFPLLFLIPWAWNLWDTWKRMKPLPLLKPGQLVRFRNPQGGEARLMVMVVSRDLYSGTSAQLESLEHLIQRNTVTNNGDKS